MFGLSFGEIAVVIVAAFLIFGPEDLPSAIKKVYTFVARIKRHVSQANFQLMELARDLEAELDDDKKKDSLPNLQYKPQALLEEITKTFKMPQAAADDLMQASPRNIDDASKQSVTLATESSLQKNPQSTNELKSDSINKKVSADLATETKTDLFTTPKSDLDKTQKKPQSKSDLDKTQKKPQSKSDLDKTQKKPQTEFPKES